MAVYNTATKFEAHNMNQYEGPDRRQPDPIQLEIESAIRLASEPKDRAFLLIMNKIAQNLEENTALTRNLSDELKAHTVAFKQHEKDEMALINQGRGFWRGMAVTVVAVQVLGGFILLDHFRDAERMRVDLDSVIVEVERHKEHHKQEERFRDGSKVR